MNEQLVTLIRRIMIGLAITFIGLGFWIGWINSILLHTAVLAIAFGIKLFNMYRFDPTTRKKKKRDGGLSGLLC